METKYGFRLIGQGADNNLGRENAKRQQLRRLTFEAIFSGESYDRNEIFS